MPDTEDYLPSRLPDHETSEWFGPEEREARFEEVTRRMMGFAPSMKLREMVKAKPRKA